MKYPWTGKVNRRGGGGTNLNHFFHAGILALDKKQPQKISQRNNEFRINSGPGKEKNSYRRGVRTSANKEYCKKFLKILLQETKIRDRSK